jgi:hypothetical protein
VCTDVVPSDSRAVIEDLTANALHHDRVDELELFVGQQFLKERIVLGVGLPFLVIVVAAPPWLLRLVTAERKRERESFEKTARRLG